MLTRVLVFFLLVARASSQAQVPTTILSAAKPSVGGIHVGMTLRDAIRMLKAEYYSHALSGDYGWFTQIHDTYSGDHNVLLSLWSDADQDYIINYDAVISNISVHSPEFKTLEGVHVGMKLKEVEKRLGTLERIFTSEPTYEQYAVFANQPKGIAFKVLGGVFRDGQRETQKFDKQAAIYSIELTGY